MDNKHKLHCPSVSPGSSSWFSLVSSRCAHFWRAIPHKSGPSTLILSRSLTSSLNTRILIVHLSSSKHVARAAIVVYQLFYRMVLGKSFGWVAMLEYLAQGSLGAVIIGLVFGMASLFWLWFIFNDTVIDFSLALTVSYIAYYTAQAAEASGILTLVALGMVFAMSKDAFKAGGKQSLHEFWEMVAYLANTLIFILSGVIIAQSFFSTRDLDGNSGKSWGYIFLLYIILQVSRAIVVFLFYPALRYFGYGLNWKEAIIIIWSGLRGAVGLALSLSVKVYERVSSCFVSFSLYMAQER